MVKYRLLADLQSIILKCNLLFCCIIVTITFRIPRNLLLLYLYLLQFICNTITCIVFVYKYDVTAWCNVTYELNIDLLLASLYFSHPSFVVWIINCLIIFSGVVQIVKVCVTHLCSGEFLMVTEYRIYRVWTGSLNVQNSFSVNTWCQYLSASSKFYSIIKVHIVYVLANSSWLTVRKLLILEALIAT